MNDKITFSFGENWSEFISTIDDNALKLSINEIISCFSCLKNFNADTFFKDKTVLDIGSGSGLSSLAFYTLGAKFVYSFDYDIKSVEATGALAAKCGGTESGKWSIGQGNALDEHYMESLPKFDIVYSWGVLHHTGQMWKALNNSLIPLKDNGYYYIALYVKSDKYPKQLALKKKYNKASEFGKKIMTGKYVIRTMLGCVRRKENPFKWNKKRSRGMNVYHDIVDWLGGLPYEVASPDEVIDFGVKYDLRLLKIKTGEACISYFFAGTQNI